MMALNDCLVLALIPARAGSKGLVGKNMCEVQGVPLVGYSLNAALNSKYIDDVYLSSDNTHTLSYGESLGAKSVLRPEEYASDTASANSVVLHFLSVLPEELLKQNPYIVYLQPSSPLRTSRHIDDALEKMQARELDKLISVVEMLKSPFKAFVVDERGGLKALFSEEMTNQRRQDLPVVYLPNGAIYVFRASDFSQKDVFPSNGSYPYVMSEIDSLDIDNEEDLDTFARTIDKSVK
jgi:CMP-N-acetylneuraminic acid synthetase